MVSLSPLVYNLSSTLLQSSLPFLPFHTPLLSHPLISLPLLSHPSIPLPLLSSPLSPFHTPLSPLLSTLTLPYPSPLPLFHTPPSPTAYNTPPISTSSFFLLHFLSFSHLSENTIKAQRHWKRGFLVEILTLLASSEISSISNTSKIRKYRTSNITCDMYILYYIQEVGKLNIH